MKLFKRTISQVLGSVLLVCAGFGFWHLLAYSSVPDNVQQEQLNQKPGFAENYRIYSVDLPKELDFCGESVPLEKLHVRESLDRELLVNTYWQSSSVLLHKRAARWFPMIEEILAEYEVPDDMKYIALIESGLQNVVSPAGATGYWQFMKQTGREFGLEINGEVDERYHVKRSTEAACKYLKTAYAKYENWTLAAASYNMGMAGLDRQLARQKAKSYYELLLVEETARYLYRAMAVKEVLTRPQHYGFYLEDVDLYGPYRTTSITVSEPVANFADMAAEYGIDYKTLKLLNPWLRDNFLANKYRKTYSILLPAEDFNQ